MEFVQGARSKAEAVVPINEAMSYVAAEFIDEHAHSAGLRLSDAMIAATAVANALPV